MKQQNQNGRGIVFIDDDQRSRSAFERLRSKGIDCPRFVINYVYFADSRKPAHRNFPGNIHNSIPKRFDDSVQQRRKKHAAVQTFHNRIDIGGAVAVVVTRQVRLVHVVDELNERFILCRSFPFVNGDIEDIANRLFHCRVHRRALRN